MATLMDHDLFERINGPGLSDFGDLLLAELARPDVATPFFVCAALLPSILGGVRWRTTVLLALAAFALCDPLNHHLIKEFFGRTRPCGALAETVLRSKSCPQSFSFPSSHVMNLSAVVAIVAWRHRALALPGLFLVGLIALSRMRSGVHYPADVAVGALAGAGMAGAILWAHRGLVAKGRGWRAWRPGRGRRPVALGVLGALALTITSCPPIPAPAERTEASLLVELDADHARSRVRAAVHVREAKDPLEGALPRKLAEALDDPVAAVRFQSAGALRHLADGDPLVLAALARSLGDPVVGVRKSAAWSLARSGTAAVPHVMAALDAEDPRVRRHAADVLRWIGPTAREAVPGLRRGLLDPEAPVRVASLLALEAIAAPSPPPSSPRRARHRG